MPRKQSLNDHQKEWAHEKWCAGYTFREIGEALKCDFSTISRTLNGMDKDKPQLVYKEDICQKKSSLKL